MSYDLTSDEKHYPPMFSLEDYSLDVATVARLRALDENIARFAGGHSQSSYIIGSSGMSGKTVTTSSVNAKLLGQIAYMMPWAGSTVHVFALLEASSGGSDYSRLELVVHPTMDFIFSDSQYQYARQYAYEIKTHLFSDTKRRWVRFDGIQVQNTFPVSMSLWTLGNGTNSVTTTLYASHVQVEDVFHVGL